VALEAHVIDVFFKMMGIGAGKSLQSRADSNSVDQQKSGKSLPDSEGKLGFHKAQAATARRQEVKAPAKKSKAVSKAAAKPTGKAKSVAKPASKPAPKPAVKKPTSKPVAKPASKAKPVAKPAAKKPAKPVAKAPVKQVAKKPSAKPAVKPTAKSAAKPQAKAPAKSSAKSNAKASAKAPVKGALKTAAKSVIKTPVKAPSKSANKPVAKPVAKSATKPASKVVAKPVVKSTAKPAAKPAVKPAVKVPAKTPVKPVNKTPAKQAAATKVAVKSAAPLAPAKPVVTPPAPPPKTKAGSRVVPSYSPSAANMSPHGGNTAAKASFTMSAPVLAPPPQLVVKKDPKLAANWKSKSAEQLSDQEVIAMPDSEYMNAKQLAFFRLKLVALKNGILSNAGETTEHLREDTSVVPDPADRATIEEEHALELRTRDRERKLLKKIEQSIVSIDADEYGYCDETGEPIGVARLIARPTATLSIEAQQRRELKQKMFGD
jgi:DnaK suppressor protein